MFTLISHRHFPFVLRAVAACWLALLLLAVGTAHASDGDGFEGGPHDYSAPTSPSSNDFDSSGRDSEQRQRDAVESSRQGYIDSQPSRQPSTERRPSYKGTILDRTRGQERLVRSSVQRQRSVLVAASPESSKTKTERLVNSPTSKLSPAAAHKGFQTWVIHSE